MTSIRRLLSQLNPDNQSENSKLVSMALKESEVDLKGYVLAMIDPDLYEFFISPEVDLSIKRYVDEDGLYKVSIGVSFVQDFNNFNKFLEQEMLETLVKEIRVRGLNLVFNDVCINGVQWRNDDK